MERTLKSGARSCAVASFFRNAGLRTRSLNAADTFTDDGAALRRRGVTRILSIGVEERGRVDRINQTAGGSRLSDVGMISIMVSNQCSGPRILCVAITWG